MDDLHGKNDNLARENKTLSDRLRECESNLKDATRWVQCKSWPMDLIMYYLVYYCVYLTVYS